MPSGPLIILMVPDGNDLQLQFTMVTSHSGGWMEPQMPLSLASRNLPANEVVTVVG